MKYDDVVSLGSNCAPALSMRILNIKSLTYPFDWIRSNSKIIYDVLVNGKEKYLTFQHSVLTDQYYISDIHYHTHPNFTKSHINGYGQHFTHYTDININELIQKFNNYLDRFFELLNSNKTILFIHSNEEFIYDKKSRDNKIELYEYLCKINDILEVKYPNLKFHIINLDIDNTFLNYKNILNFSINYGLPFSDFCENDSPIYCNMYTMYRNAITNFVQTYLNEHDQNTL